MDTLESLRRKLNGAEDLKSVVRTMKAVAASNIGQYELAVSSLGDYYRTVTLGIIAYFKAEGITHIPTAQESKLKNTQRIGAIVFGSDQGLVGQFNDSLVSFVTESLHHLPKENEIWAVGERVQLLLSDVGFKTEKLFNVPNSVHAITPVIGEILLKAQEQMEQGKLKAFYIFHNAPKNVAGYTPVMQRLLPLDEKWKRTLEEIHWPTKSIPQIAGGVGLTLSALIHEYLFVSLFKSCAESLASENASRLAAMQRAEKNIDELLDDLASSFHRLRQSSIDEELFDVVSGFENMKKDGKHKELTS